MPFKIETKYVCSPLALEICDILSESSIFIKKEKKLTE